MPEVPKTGPLLTVVIPTFNEALNIPVLVDRLERALRGIDWEVVFVDDDSPDLTARVVRQLALANARVRCIRRIGRRGLAGACLEGALSSQAPYVAIMDADLQHDEALLGPMLQTLQDGEAALVVGSRYSIGGADDGFSPARRLGSQIAALLVRLTTSLAITDPMSGFFMARRELLDDAAPRLSPEGFKILLDLLLTAPGELRISELPYTFRSRVTGDSKFDLRNMMDFLGLLIAKGTRGVLPLRFINFLFVGLSGVFVQLVALKIGLAFGLQFPPAQVAATVVAMTSNFFLNNLLTYRDWRLSGWSAVAGLMRFYLVCSIGALSNVSVSSLVYAAHPVWWIAGLVGSVIGAVWNFATSSAIVWGRK